MRTHKISVTMDAAAIRVEPDTLMMTSEDEVHWSGNNAQRFSIQFEGASPFAERRFDHDAATRARRPQGKGHFKYTVISVENPAIQLDPVIVVGDPDTGSNP